MFSVLQQSILGRSLALCLRLLVLIDMDKHFSVFFDDSVSLDAVARAVQSFSGFEIESEGVLTAADHLVPDVAFFQRRPLVRASPLNGVENAGAAQNQQVFSIGQLGSEEARLFQVGKLSDKNGFHGWVRQNFSR